MTTQKENQNVGGWLKNRDVGENAVGGKGEGKGNKLKKTRRQGMKAKTDRKNPAVVS